MTKLESPIPAPQAYDRRNSRFTVCPAAADVWVERDQWGHSSARPNGGDTLTTIAFEPQRGAMRANPHRTHCAVLGAELSRPFRPDYIRLASCSQDAALG